VPAAKETDLMILVREVLSCKPGKVGELREKFASLGAVMEEMGYTPFRMLTDVSGERFWTLVLESECERLDDFREMEARVMSDDRARSIMSGYHDLVLSGRREIFKVEG
jgi:hypothetical protein